MGLKVKILGLSPGSRMIFLNIAITEAGTALTEVSRQLRLPPLGCWCFPYYTVVG